MLVPNAKKTKRQRHAKNENTELSWGYCVRRAAREPQRPAQEKETEDRSIQKTEKLNLFHSLTSTTQKRNLTLHPANGEDSPIAKTYPAP